LNGSVHINKFHSLMFEIEDVKQQLSTLIINHNNMNMLLTSSFFTQEKKTILAYHMLNYILFVNSIVYWMMCKITHNIVVWWMILGLWCLTSLSSIFQSVLLVDETWVPRENYWPVTDKLYHIMLYRVHLTMNRVQTHNFCGDRHWFFEWFSPHQQISFSYVWNRRC
jgi:hypothetical protein